MSSDLERFLGLADQIPGFLGRCVETAERFENIGKKGRASYRETHWGDEGDEPATWDVNAPDPRTGLAEMGRLVAIEYLTRKGAPARGAPKLEVFRHVFGRGGERGPHGLLPVLAYTHEERPSGLVVVRDTSRYSVTKHGIEG